jgi:exonuclease SbcD
MTDPMCFIERTINQYPQLDLEEIREAFEEIKEEVHRMAEAEKSESKSKKKTNDSTK